MKFIGCILTLVAATSLFAFQNNPTQLKTEQSEKPGIYPYQKERDYQFIMDILAKDPHNFPDAANVADFDNENSQMTAGWQKINFNQKIFVYCNSNSEPVGFIRTFDFGNGSSMIAQMAIAQNYRRMGIGEKLLKCGVENLKSRKVNEIILDTMADNLGAHALYEKAGFKKTVNLGTHYLYRMDLTTKTT